MNWKSVLLVCPETRPRVLHRPPLLSTGTLAGQSRLLIRIDTAS